jgi:hypothetical protein
MDIDVVGESQLVGFPSQFPSVTMVDWTTGAPNARFEVLRLLHDVARPGVERAATRFPGSDIDAQAFLGANRKQVLLVNKRDRAIEVELPADFIHARVLTVDETTNSTRPVATDLRSATLTLAPFAVSVLTAR